MNFINFAAFCYALIKLQFTKKDSCFSLFNNQNVLACDVIN